VVTERPLKAPPSRKEREKGRAPGLSDLRRFLLRHLGVEGFGAFFDLLFGHVLGMSAQTPGVALGIDKASIAVSPEHICHRHGGLASGIHGALKRFVHVLDVQIEAAAGAS